MHVKLAMPRLALLYELASLLIHTHRCLMDCNISSSSAWIVSVCGFSVCHPPPPPLFLTEILQRRGLCTACQSPCLLYYSSWAPMRRHQGMLEVLAVTQSWKVYLRNPSLNIQTILSCWNKDSSQIQNTTHVLAFCVWIDHPFKENHEKMLFSEMDWWIQWFWCLQLSWLVRVNWY